MDGSDYYCSAPFWEEATGTIWQPLNKVVEGIDDLMSAK